MIKPSQPDQNGNNRRQIFAAAIFLLTGPFFAAAAANIRLTWTVFRPSKFSANFSVVSLQDFFVKLTVLCCSKFSANLTFFFSFFFQ